MPYLTIILCGDTRREMEEWITALRNITLRNSNVRWYNNTDDALKTKYFFFCKHYFLSQTIDCPLTSWFKLILAPTWLLKNILFYSLIFWIVYRMVITGIHVPILAPRYVMFVVNCYPGSHPEVYLVKVCYHVTCTILYNLIYHI